MCARDFHVALWHKPVGELSYTGLLNTRREIGLVGDPPSHNCGGDSETANEIAVLEFWRRLTAPGTPWERVPDLERSLEESDAARQERHREGWARIRRFRDRPEGLMGSWRSYPAPPDFPHQLPRPYIERSDTTGKFIDTPRLNQRRRLALLAISGRVSLDEFEELEERPQTEYADYEARRPATRAEWAESLMGEVREIDETVLANAIVGYWEMSSEQREERYCHGLNKLLYELAVEGKIAPEERQQVVGSLIRNFYTF
jgi:hypothetical protein